MKSKQENWSYDSNDRLGGWYYDEICSINLELLKEEKNMDWKRQWTFTHWVWDYKENNNYNLKNSLHLRRLEGMVSSEDQLLPRRERNIFLKGVKYIKNFGNHRSGVWESKIKCFCDFQERWGEGLGQTRG